MAASVQKNITIPNGATVSGLVDIDLSYHLLSGITFPAEFDGTAVTFKASASPDGTFYDVYNTAGTLLTVTTAASRHVLLEPQTFAGAQFLKLVCGTAQTGATVLTLNLLEGT